MQSLGCLAAFLQDDSALQHDVHLMTIFMGIIAAAVICGFLGVCIAGLMGLKLVRKFEGMAERAEAKVSPMLEKTQSLVEELGPKVRTITTNVEQISYSVRTKVDEFSATANDINRTVKDINRTVKDANARTQEKVARVDGMVNEALNTAHHISRTVQESVRKPVQQIAGIIAGLRSGIETLVERSPLKRQAQQREPGERVRTAADYSRRAYDVPTSEPDATAGTSGQYRPASPSPSPNPANETKRVTPYG